MWVFIRENRFNFRYENRGDFLNGDFWVKHCHDFQKAKIVNF